MRIAVIDFETTGLLLAPSAKRSGQPRAIEFAGCVVGEDLSVQQELDLLIDPGIPIGPEITRITGITQEAVAGQPDFAAAWPRIEEFLDGCDALVAHNLSFDAYILRSELTRIGARWVWPRGMLCTVELFEPIWGYRPRLIQLYERVTGNEYAQTHRALDDVRALTEVITHETVFPAVAAAAVAHRAFIPPELRAD